MALQSTALCCSNCCYSLTITAVLESMVVFFSVRNVFLTKNLNYAKKRRRQLLSPFLLTGTVLVGSSWWFHISPFAWCGLYPPVGRGETRSSAGRNGSSVLPIGHSHSGGCPCTPASACCGQSSFNLPTAKGRRETGTAHLPVLNTEVARAENSTWMLLLQTLPKWKEAIESGITSAQPNIIHHY